MRSACKRQGHYPDTNQRPQETIVKTKISIGTKQSFLLVTYESQKTINIYVGGHDKWCINAELIKRDTVIQPLGYLIKLRYDIYCSLEHSYTKGKDTKQLLFFLVQYINNKYPQVKELLFNDMSTKECISDHSINAEVNLAVMTYLYSEKTWYEKASGAFAAPQSEKEFVTIKSKFRKAKETPWDIMSATIKNHEQYSGHSDNELETLYQNSKSWKEFFEPIYKKIDISDFCVFISIWLDSFILKYFNNLQSLTFIMPIKDYGITYTPQDYIKGGRSITRRRPRIIPSRDCK